MPESFAYCHPHSCGDKEHSQCIKESSARSRKIKQSLEVLHYLNQMDSINSKALYDEALKLFNVEIRQSGRGHTVIVTDGEGKVICYPIRLSKFKEQPKFYQKKKQKNDKYVQMSEERKIKKIDFKTDFLKEVFCQIRMNKQGTRKMYCVKSKGKKKR